MKDLSRRSLLGIAAGAAGLPAGQKRGTRPAGAAGWRAHPLEGIGREKLKVHRRLRLGKHLFIESNEGKE